MTRNELTIGRKVLHTVYRLIGHPATIIAIEVNRELGVRYFRIRLDNGVEKNVRAGELFPV